MNSPITLDALKVLDAIERKKSFAAAADELFRVPSAISYTVNKLEEDLDIALFDRSKRKAELTAVGNLIVEQGRLILQATDELTYMAKQSASGWELELRIAVDSILHFQPIYSLIAQFQISHPWIDIKVTEEVFGGTWDALSAGRCDLVIGAAGTARDNSFNIHPIGDIEFIFAVAKDHPLCQEQQPLSNTVIKKYPSVVVADSSRELAARSAGLLDGQPRITVPSIDQKIEVQLLGLGVGYLPVHRIQQQLKSGQLVALTLEKPDNRNHDMCAAWRKENKGKALAWFVEKIKALKNDVFFTEDPLN
ncbi:LysR family transcriptional regulator [Shewanella sp. Choline-02u-19]|uniref:LysR substrate-binding domain-containing protein n=1 Tax=unclassified Shewanella TaxID=196818 RepID=UPI000C31C864|nr:MULTISPECIES: LysR substrate-binding domain-containing protein [unclassified Shewanella]PKG75621.1 LysR family transcriptional regulator [Shewanella sp. GutCb]PKH56479.1 LysR family transcriptional regulator [Shewanella sp. Bg11-22]PKI28015.1 LysR family transcriptional regulator [Shewanella sp. Choline-02u-19]